MSLASIFSDYIEKLNPMHIPTHQSLESITSSYMSKVRETQRMNIRSVYLDYFEVHKVYMKFINEFIDATTKGNCKNYGLQKLAIELKGSVVSVHDAMKKHYDATNRFMMDLSDIVKRHSRS